MFRLSARPALLFLISFSCFLPAGFAQDQGTAPAGKPVFVSPSQRLMQAKSVYMKNAGGSSIPFDVISGAITEWPRFVVQDAPEKADLFIEVTSPEDPKPAKSDSRTTIGTDGMPQQSISSSHEIGDDRVRMIVRDAKTRIVLWNSTVQVKSAMKKRSWNDNLVEAGQSLVTQFHDRLEPASVTK